ncbi:hypothetical protein ACFL27_00505 [candidate division CSSED10-310 bacterium]|uniref:Ppx/GppA phosphatase N-terminal domain-containing protein n=1 Tax=candidate division CSSED10-310 bacterium TaxID=2855610 RepID=A0ABV6YR32_UNCC1
MDDKQTFAESDTSQIDKSSLWAAIDVGSNSTLLLIADIGARQNREKTVIKPLLEQTKTTRLGSELATTGLISQKAMSDTENIIWEYYCTCCDLGVLPENIMVAGTFALREARNREEFRKKIFRRCGLNVAIISPEREAALVWSAATAALSMSDFPYLVFDIGGGSTEIMFLKSPSNRLQMVSIELGCLSLTEKFALTTPTLLEIRKSLFTDIQKTLRNYENSFEKVPEPQAIGVGGTMTTVAAIRKELGHYDANLIHGTTVSTATVVEIFEYLWALPPAERRTVTGLSQPRADIILAGLAICLCIMDWWRIKSVTISTWGLRHGLLLDIH